MGFGEVFGESWRDYKANFKEMSKVQLLFYILPYLVVTGIVIFLFYSMGIYDGVKDFYTQSMSTLQEIISRTVIDPTYSPQDSDITDQLSIFVTKLLYDSIPFILISLFLVIISSIFALYGYSGIITSSVKNKKFTFSDAISEARKNFGKILGLFASIFAISIVYSFVLILLVSLLRPIGLVLVLPWIIIAVWVGISWSFSLMFIVAEGKGVFKSLASSWAFVKGRWWKTFGYILLFCLITLAFSIVMGRVKWILQVIVLNSYGLPQTLDLYEIFYLTFDEVFNYLAIKETVETLIKLIYNFLIIPLNILFLKNLYVTWKKQRK
ncbi:hypothetical protein FJZ18_03120 [Candidatus Pacearchaeota archaeon]|nr:hypothetical protein [Candidatus Pacearchaeota archaeon]